MQIFGEQMAIKFSRVKFGACILHTIKCTTRDAIEIFNSRVLRVKVIS